MKGRVTITDLMDRPFRELHELYKILFDRAEAEKRRREEEEAKAKEEEERKRQSEINRGIKPKLNRMPPPDAIRNNPSDIQTPSPLEAEALEDALEEMAEGGVI